MCTNSTAISILELTDAKLDQAANLYAQGLLMETPPGSKEPVARLALALREDLRKFVQNPRNRCIWVASKEAKPSGLLDFYHVGHTIRIRFLCAVPPRQGTGTRLMHHLAQYALQNDVDTIHTTVSSLDQRAINFYFHHLGFQRIGRKPEGSGFDLFLAMVTPSTLLQGFATTYPESKKPPKRTEI